MLLPFKGRLNWSFEISQNLNLMDEHMSILAAVAELGSVHMAALSVENGMFLLFSGFDFIRSFTRLVLEQSRLLPYPTWDLKRACLRLDFFWGRSTLERLLALQVSRIPDLLATDGTPCR